MRFIILMTDGADAWDRLTDEAKAKVMEGHRELRRTLEAEGKYVASYRLAPRATARTARRDSRGRITVHDGPFAETKEVVGGLYVIEAESLEAALEWARRSRFITGSNEVRAVVD